ncbi:hypothetical protein IM043_gp178 [Bacillus phage SPG24]|nr:hypothetical protein IM043_gp178 [Bacillus phage SPG24]
MYPEYSSRRVMIIVRAVNQPD